MNNSEPLNLRTLIDSNLAVTKERMPFNQMMTCKAAILQRVIQVMHRVVQKSCRRACELFCCPLDNLLPDRITCCPGQIHQPKEDETTQVTLRSLPSTILIVNISNSTLIDCVIGNHTYPSTMAESQPLMQQSELQMHDQVRCRCGQQGAAQTSPPPPPPPHPLPSAESPNINIHSSHLNCVIIGDNNYMHTERSHLTEIEEFQV